METNELIGVGLLVAATIAGLMAYKGKVSWKWFAGLLTAGIGAFLLRRRRAAEIVKPPIVPPALDAMEPIITEVEAEAAKERDKIKDAESEEDRLLRLKELSELNDSGAE